MGIFQLDFVRFFTHSDERDQDKSLNTISCLDGVPSILTNLLNYTLHDVNKLFILSKYLWAG